MRKIGLGRNPRILKTSLLRNLRALRTGPRRSLLILKTGPRCSPPVLKTGLLRKRLVLKIGPHRSRVLRRSLTPPRPSRSRIPRPSLRATLLPRKKSHGDAAGNHGLLVTQNTQPTANPWAAFFIL